MSALDMRTVPAPWRALVSEINGGRILDGAPGIRDVDAPCDDFEPADGKPDGSGDCETDGHCICSECVHIALKTIRERRGLCVDCGGELTRVDGIETCAADCEGWLAKRSAT